MPNKNGTTLPGPTQSFCEGPRTHVCLTIISHPDTSRIGEMAVLFKMGAGAEGEVSRETPEFKMPRGNVCRALLTQFLSRRPFKVVGTRNQPLRVKAESGANLVVNGERVSGERVVTDAELLDGVPLMIGSAVVLWLHATKVYDKWPDDLGMIGEGMALQTLREEILRVARTDKTVLLRGETGVGKELAAAAIHNHSGRRGGCLIVNIASLNKTTFPSELFGYEKGAFTGATEAHDGFFIQAKGGTLFLDEIGALEPDLQPVLLRALEDKRVFRVGAAKPTPIDVRFIAATDADLEAGLEKGTYSRAFFERLKGYPIRVPPLRERREDFGRLFFSFLREGLKECNAGNKLERAGETAKPWVPASLVCRLLAYDWPGNVRELSHVAQQIAIANSDREKFTLPAELVRLFGPTQIPQRGPGEVVKKSPSSAKHAPGNITRAEVIDALSTHDYNVKKAAAALGVSRGTMFKLMETHGVRKAADLSEQDVRSAIGEVGTCITDLTRKLGVSAHGLKLRMSALGIELG